jgi:hypothetical protein
MNRLLAARGRGFCMAMAVVMAGLAPLISADRAFAWGAGGGGGGGGVRIDNRTAGQKAMDKRSKDNPNRSRSKNRPAGDPGLRPGNGPISNGPYSNGQNGGH